MKIQHVKASTGEQNTKCIIRKASNQAIGKQKDLQDGVAPVL